MSAIKNSQISLYFHFNKILELGLGTKKGLELVSNLQHGTKNMLEMFVIQHTSI